MLASEPMLPWDGGDRRLRCIPRPKTRLTCMLYCNEATSMLASEPMLPWDGGDRRFWRISQTHTHLVFPRFYH